MSLINSIITAELQYKQILEDFFILIYKGNPLSSHGLNHHRRVWNYSKELLLLFAEDKTKPILVQPHELIISTYLHDLGMSIEPGFTHGKHSRDLCIQFLKKYKLPVQKHLNVLEAIENHDRKDYTSDSNISDLLTILTVADDLDAFSFTGIFRYIEIYLLRNISSLEIGHFIIDNSTKRYNNFITTFGFNNALVDKHKTRFNTLSNFFLNYNTQIDSYQFNHKNPSGYCGVVENIQHLLLNKLSIRDLIKEPEKFSYDPVLLWFFNSLASELS
jgi:HD superfamily phosphodiesterase